MEAAPTPEVVSGSKLKVEEVSAVDTERPQASPQQGAGSLLPLIEGDPWRWVRVRGCGWLWGLGRTSHHRYRR
jgi:hypothetical protein